jgi:hypothetical protein
MCHHPLSLTLNRSASVMLIYEGYIYIWFDTIENLFYIGGHKGTVEDAYVCSNKKMLSEYKVRPSTFKFKVLEYVRHSADIRHSEQKWLRMIKKEELYTEKNITNNYNIKKHSSGGNGNANKGNSNLGGHNKGKPMSAEQKRKISLAMKGKTKSSEHKAKISLAMKKYKVDSVSTLHQAQL